MAARILAPPTREDAPVVPVADTLVARARRVSTRAWLHGARLLIVHLAAHDGCGQPVASTVVPLLVRSHTDPDVELEAAAAAASGWFARVRAGQNAFCLQRARRADALLARCAHRDDTSYQSGLFDQRAETEHALADASARDDIQDAAARLDAIREQTTLTLSRPQLRLVLEP